MGLFNFFSRGNSAHPRTRGKNIELSNDGFARIKAPEFFGEYRRSPNGKWVICWLDADPSGTRGGARDSGKGLYLLYDLHRDKVVLDGCLERPNNGHVADVGVYLLEDWKFGAGLNGMLYAGDPSGKVLLRHTFDANIYNSEVSADGTWAVCQTCNSPESEDGDRLALFDLLSGRVLFSVHPETGWADSYDLRPSDGTVFVVLKGIGRLAYDANGRFLDASAYEDARLKRGDFGDLLCSAEKLLKERPGNPAAAQRALEAATRARTAGADACSDWKARALKIQGLALEVLDRPAEALAAYSEALTLNPKIGVKRRADQLRKHLP